MSMLDWRYYPKIARIARMAGADVGRGSETLMTYSRGDLFRAARHLSNSKEGRPARALVVTGFYIPRPRNPLRKRTARWVRWKYAWRCVRLAATHGWSATNAARR